MTITPTFLSGSVSGRAIVIIATSSSGTLIHQATNTAGAYDNVHLTFSNPTANPTTANVEWGTTAVAANIKITVSPSGSVNYPFTAIGGNQTITCYASSVSGILVSGRIYTEAP